MNVSALYFTETEAQFQASVIRLAQLLGWRVWHDRATNARRTCPDCGARTRVPRNDAGLPDLLLIRRPRLVVIECKSERGKPTRQQLEWLAALQDCGIESYVLKPSMWKRLEEILR